MQFNSVTEVCQRLRIGRSTLYERINRGEVAVTKIGSRTLIAEGEIEKLIEVGTRRIEPASRRSGGAR